MNLINKLRDLSLSQCLLIGFVIMGLYYFLGYNSGVVEQGKIEAKKTEIKDLETKIADENKKIEQIEQFKNAVKYMGQDFQAFVTYIPAKFTKYDLIKSISQEAKAAGIGISRIDDSADKAETFGFYEQFQVKGEFVGTFQQIMLFLSFLTRTEQIVTVDEIDLGTNSSGRSNAESPVLRVSTSIVGYRYLADNKGAVRK